MPLFCFTGHPAGKQSLASPDEDACVPGIGRWPKDAERVVSEEIAALLRHAPGFREVVTVDIERAGEATSEDASAAPDEALPPTDTPDADATEATGQIQGE